MMRLALGMAAVAAAFATPVLADSIPLGYLSENVFDENADWVGGTPMTQAYSFSLDQSGGGVAGNANNYGLGNFTATLTGPSNYSHTLSFDQDANTSYHFDGLSAGNYTLTLVGTPSFPRHTHVIGGYNLTIHAAAAPVPGPAGWLVAVVGVGLIGFTQRHRFRKVAAA